MPVSRRRLTGLLVLVAGTLLAIAPSGPAAAHDATTTAYLEATQVAGTTDVEVTVEAEYDLLMKSAWLEAPAYEATARDEQRRQLALNADAVGRYVTDRLEVAYQGQECTPTAGTADMRERRRRAHAVVPVTFGCPAGDPGAEAVHAVSSTLFPDAEGFVHSTEALLVYDLDERSGETLLDAQTPTFIAGEQSTAEELGEFFVHGAEHLLFGLDHVLFLLILILGSRSLREIVLTTAAFTVAHSVTFLLAALGLVDVPAIVVEPVIAASIALTAAVCLWSVVVRTDLERTRPSVVDRLRFPVVFAFGLVHGLGFAGALGIDEPWSWGLLAALVSFNVGIEVTQLVIVVLVFPALMLMARRAPQVARVGTAAAAGAVTLVGAYWTLERLLAG
ncbi:HupE/UreJ family protein [Mumia sp. ZJ430]|uniref:HupE/UreJ family protein n=1 Tax=Mumia sp. ZJ430 TaxID=2708083 RepID=UPI001421C83D|nr:HupE/UreJ family protein [Mumia sp. ZJ430]